MDGEYDFHWAKCPGIKKKLQSLDGALGMNTSQLVDIAFKVYNAWEERKVKRAMVFLETG